MLKESRNPAKYPADIEALVTTIKKKGFETIKADLPEYDKPSGMKGVGKDVEYIPDISAKRYEGTNFFEISEKTTRKEHLVTKWKLLATIAGMKRGKLFIYMPKGTVKFTRELVEKYQINAELEKF